MQKYASPVQLFLCRHRNPYGRMHRRQHVKCAVTGWTCTVLALQAQAALWEERADPVRQQLKQLQWELRGTHAAVRALEQQVR